MEYLLTEVSMTGPGGAQATSSSLTPAPTPLPQSSSGVSSHPQVLRFPLGTGWVSRCCQRHLGNPRKVEKPSFGSQPVTESEPGWEAQCQNRQDRISGPNHASHQPSQSATHCSCHFCQRCRTPNELSATHVGGHPSLSPTSLILLSHLQQAGQALLPGAALPLLVQSITSVVGSVH